MYGAARTHIFLYVTRAVREIWQAPSGTLAREYFSEVVAVEITAVN